MNRTLTIPAELYERLDAEARSEGLKGVEALLSRISSSFADRKRREVVSDIHRLRHRLEAKYGKLPDSTESIREDRER